MKAKRVRAFVYDRAEYHIDEVRENGLPDHHAYHHTTFFLSWLIQNRLTSSFFESEGRDVAAKYRAGKISINELFEWWDTSLVSEMLSDEGNAFAKAYFDLQKSDQYLRDYYRTLRKKGAPSDYHVEYSPENEALIHEVISKRYRAWKAKEGASRTPEGGSKKHKG